MRRALGLGPAVVQRLLPHRRPFLMVDAIDAYQRGERPVLEASRFISANEPVFDGHFPGLAIWPGVYTIEGMGQTGQLLAIIDFIEQGLVARGADPDLLLDGLANIDLGARLHPGHRAEENADLERVLAGAIGDGGARATLGLSVRVDVKLTAPVFPGQKLDYRVQRTHLIDGMLRFDVGAAVSGHAVASGTMTAAFGMGRAPGASMMEHR